MFSKPNNPRSIAAQLVVLFTMAAAVLLGSALGGLYWLVVRHAFAEDNAVLADKIRGLRSELQEPDGLRAVSQELISRRAGEPTIYWVRIVGPQSEIKAETPRMNKVLPPSIFADLTQHSADSPKDFHEPDRQFSLVQFDETVNGQSYRIQVGQDRSEDEHFRKTFGALLWGTLGLGTVAIAAIAISVTRRGLRPLREIARMVGDVGPARLSERLTQRGWPTEIKPLAEAFDEMLARLQDAFTRLSQFSADLAHELRTPVGNLLGEAQVALRRERPSQDYRQVIESSLAECERLSAIIDNLLFLARAEAADRQVQRISFDASSAVAKIIAMYEPVAEEQQVTLHCGGNGQVYADPILFQRAVNNLVENALRHTPSGGSVLVRITTKSGDVRIEVTDTGCGIAPEHQAHVFDRFYRVDPSRNSEGTGLGLALVKSIMDLHNGRAELRSQRGVGTTVTISFPNDRATAAVPPIAPDTLIRPAG